MLKGMFVCKTQHQKMPSNPAFEWIGHGMSPCQHIYYRPIGQSVNTVKVLAGSYGSRQGRLNHADLLSGLSVVNTDNASVRRPSVWSRLLLSEMAGLSDRFSQLRTELTP